MLTSSGAVSPALIPLTVRKYTQQADKGIKNNLINNKNTKIMQTR